MAQGSIGGFLPLSGGTLTGPIVFSSGTANDPAVAVGQSNTGFYRRTTDLLDLTIAGGLRMEWSATAFRRNSAVVDGWTSGAASVAIDTGLSRVSAGVLALGNGTAGNASGTLQANIQLSSTYVAGAVVGTGSVTLKDSTGTTYRVPVLV